RSSLPQWIVERARRFYLTHNNVLTELSIGLMIRRSSPFNVMMPGVGRLRTERAMQILREERGGEFQDRFASLLAYTFTPKTEYLPVANGLYLRHPGVWTHHLATMLSKKLNLLRKWDDTEFDCNMLDRMEENEM